MYIIYILAPDPGKYYNFSEFGNFLISKKKRRNKIKWFFSVFFFYIFYFFKFILYILYIIIILFFLFFVFINIILNFILKYFKNK
jgi:hypothetical protein